MHVGLDAIPLATPRTGVGHYTFELARHLALIAPDNQFELVSPFLNPTPPEAEQTPSNLKFIHAKVNMIRRRWFAVGLPLYIRRARYDLYHGTNYEVPLLAKCPTVLTIHDLSLFLHPTTHEERLVRRGRRRLPIMARSATHIITPSESVRREVCEHLSVKPSKVTAIPEAARSIFQRQAREETVETLKRLGVEDSFVLAVGTIEPRKNLHTLLRAFEQMVKQTSRRPQLVIAGKRGWLTSELFRDVENSIVKDRLLFTDYVSDEELRALYSACTLFVYPSLYEGFGLPPLEAMACGAPVIASRIPSIVETVGVDTARLIAPTDTEEIARNMAELLDSEEERRGRSVLGEERVARFTWEHTARATLDVYEALIERTTIR